MPPAKKTTAKPGPRKMTAAHKKALADGRAMSATVDRYLTSINTPKRRGRKVSTATLETRLRAAQSRSRSATGVEKVVAAQEVRDLRAKLTEAKGTGNGADLKAVEAAFVKVARKFGEARGITYGAWRDAGVSAAVLKKAGVARTRG
ncbi:MAG: hypothetical protein ACKO1Y_06565 [Actinomycetota bacterium]